MAGDLTGDWDNLIQRLNSSKTAPGTRWWRFWLAYDSGMFFFGERPRRKEIEGL
jgi:hypothetical protein